MNVDWISRQLGYIYFAYGLCLATLFLVCYFLHSLERDRPEKPPWLLFGLFGLANAAHQWFGMVSFLGFDGRLLAGSRLLLLVVAFLFLLEFGRRATPRLAGARAAWALHGALVLFTLSGLPHGLSGVEAAVRHFLALPAGILAAWVFFQGIKKQPANLRPPFRLLSVTIAVFALSTGAIVPESGFTPAGVLNDEAFLRLTGFPVQLLRGLLAVLITVLLGWYSVLSARLSRRSLFGAAGALAMLAAIVFGWYLTEHLDRRAARELENIARTDVDSLVLHVVDVLDTADRTAMTMAEYPALREALASQKPADLDQANTILDLHQMNMGMAVCYLMDGAGLTIASSNRAARDSFVGKSYAFRAYFTEAIAGKPGKYFALGVTSGERGYYTGSPVADKAGKILGVVVVKSGADALTRAFAKYQELFLVSPEGVIFLAGSQEYLSRTLWPVEAGTRAALLASRQFGAVSFEPLLESEPSGSSYLKRAGRRTLILRAPISVAGWSVVLLHGTASSAIARALGIGITFVVSMVIMFAFMTLVSENSLQTSLKLLELQRRNENVLNEQLLLQEFIAMVSRTLQSPNAIASVLQQETEIVVRHMGAAFARIWILNPATNLLELRASGGLYTHLDGAHASIPVGQGKIGRIAQEGRPLLTNTIIGDPMVLDQEWARREGMQAFVGYPLRIEGRVIGVLALFARQALSESILEAFGMAADFIASYIERKQAEAALKESEERYRNVYDTAPLAFVLWDTETRVVDWNEQAERMFGWTRKEVSGQPFFDYIIPASTRHHVQEIVGLLLAGKLPSSSTNENCTKSGRSIVCEWNNSIIRDRGGNVVGVLSLGLDITERKRAEEALQERTQQLEELTRNLETKVAAEIAVRSRNEQMLVQQSKMAAMGEMLGAIAHQWRQPLNTLGMCVQNISDASAHGDLDRSYLDKTVRKSMDQIQHMSTTIDDFRNFFRPDKEKSRFDAMVAVGDVLSLLSAQLTSNDIGFRLTCRTHARSFEQCCEFEVCPEKTVEVYRNEFEHVILNLIINARDAIAARRQAAPDGASGRGLITFDFFNRDGAVIIEVGDNGAGILETIMPRIFEPYFTSKEPSKGTGIGLYMSKIMIEEHMQGSLAVNNGPEGAIFSIMLRQAGKEIVS